MSYAAKTLAWHYHEEQMYGDKPYTYHLSQVGDLYTVLFGGDYVATEVTLLHDILEDTNVTSKILKDSGITTKAIAAVELLTKDTKLSYFENIQRIINSKNMLAIRVKYCDNLANYSAHDATDTKNKAKYYKSMEMLRKVIYNETT